ncbi:MAG: Prepilin-type N-terminal cleavage/methylation protein [Verrucomicrobiaceae bacterium]|nr:Prepilin-type N-terminal cleavage/methylation protein [Verrucomicrobiaceae bacterium]
MELMVVVAIMALLATLTLMGFRYAQITAMRNRSTAFLKGISSGLENYHSEFGEYPRPKKTAITSDFGSKTYNVGGALMLYQALSGDGDSEIEIASASLGASNGRVEGQEVNHMMMKEMPNELWKRDTSGYIVVDGFSHPFQYQAPNPENKVQHGTATQKAESETINATYDLWSFGEDDQHTNQVTMDVKQNEATSGKWIKNW